MSTRFQTIQKVVTLVMLMALVLSSFASPVALASGMMEFTVRIENISSESTLPGPLSPGIWATHSDAEPFFTVGEADRGEGLAAIAEDGNPEPLATTLANQVCVAHSGVFNTPVGAGGPAPIFPGEAYEFTVMAEPTTRYLSLATMLVQSNDVFIGPDEMGIALFDGDGNPISGDVTDQVEFWDAGSELNEAPGMGPNQAPRQAAANTGPAEGVVSAFNNSTRALPVGGIASVSVSEVDGTFSIALENVSASSGALDTPIAPVFWATHDETFQLFTTGMADDGNGLETLAEDGSPADLVASYTGAAGTGDVGAAGDGPILTGGSFEFDVTPSSDFPYLTLAAMVVQTNDAFLAFGPDGVALMDDTGMARAAADVEADVHRLLAVWDAGTEANEVPGVGVNQAPRQPAGNTGPADPDNTVRFYADSTNDLAGGLLGGFADLSITNVGGNDFEVTLTNSSDETVYPGILTPLLWALHDHTASLFHTGMPASAGLESLSEDGDPNTLLAEVGALAGVSASGVLNMPVGSDAAGPLFPGDSYSATITVDVSAPYLSIADMVVPSNDTFLAFGPEGLALLNPDGSPRSDADIAADIAADLIAWDAGTERNQAGAAGPDQAPRQAAANTGADEGDGYVRLLTSPDPVWSYPNVSDVASVTVTPSTSVRGMTTFTVRIENLSADSTLPTPLSPGVWAIHSDAGPFFTVGEADRGEGLAAIAEDGNPEPLATTLANQVCVADSAVFNTPVEAGGPAPIFPGEAYEFTVMAEPTNRYLSLATMLVQSNDIFIGPDGTGIALFDGDGNPISGDVTDQVEFWDVGSEMNEAPGMGPNQAPRQGTPNTGPVEGVVSAFNNSTRALPVGGIASVSVSETDGTFSIVLENVSASSGALDTPIAPVFWATHDETFQLFTTGMADDGNGLETLAEDGSPADLVASYTGTAGTGDVGAAGDGPILTGGSFEFDVTPSADYPYLTLAAMVVQSNDAFLAFGPEGVALMDDTGMARAAADVEADVHRLLAVWDAGTEANEVPGVGVNQAPRQAAGNTGPADPDNTVRFYADSTNDLAGGLLGGFADLSIVNVGGNDFEVTLTNSSDETVYPGILTPMLWAVHDHTASLFHTGMPASPGLESLSEDGDPTTLLAEVGTLAGVSAEGVLDMPVGSDAAGPLFPGDSYSTMITVDVSAPYLSIANMVVPSNDTFLAFGPEGLALLNPDGSPRTDADIAADIEADLIAWDAGTERNQAGAGGPDQAPRQAAANTGADEGDGYVRLLTSPDPVWSYPDVSDVLRITITPAGATAVSVASFESTQAPFSLPLIFGLAALGLMVAVGVVRKGRES